MTEQEQLRMQITRLLAEKKQQLTNDLRKQPFQQNAVVSPVPEWAIQTFVEYMTPDKDKPGVDIDELCGQIVRLCDDATNLFDACDKIKPLIEGKIIKNY